MNNIEKPLFKTYGKTKVFNIISGFQIKFNIHCIPLKPVKCCVKIYQSYLTLCVQNITGINDITCFNIFKTTIALFVQII